MTANGGAPRFRSLADYYEHPELLRPPTEILPKLAWEGRSTLLAAPEKSGKSTLVRCGVAALSTSGDFLGSATKAGRARTIWIALDEPVGDLVRGLHELGVPGAAVMIAETRPGSEELRTMVRDFQPALIVVDCLTAFAEGLVQDSGRAEQWQPVLRPFNEILREGGAAGILIHHTVRDGSRYADSRQLGASVDAILEMTISNTDETLREVRSRGRVRSERFSMRYLDGRYDLEGSELPLELRVYRVVQRDPGIGTTRLRSRVGGKTAAIDACIRDLRDRGVIEDRGNGNGHAYFTKLPISGSGPGHPRVRVGSDSLSDAGQPGSGQCEASSQGYPDPPLIRGERVRGQEPKVCNLCGTTLRKRGDGLWRCPACTPHQQWAPQPGDAIVRAVCSDLLGAREPLTT